MMYCRFHDFAFCHKHIHQCLGKPNRHGIVQPCRLIEDDRAHFCAVCVGILAENIRLSTDSERHDNDEN